MLAFLERQADICKTNQILSRLESHTYSALLFVCGGEIPVLDCATIQALQKQPVLIVHDHVCLDSLTELNAKTIPLACGYTELDTILNKLTGTQKTLRRRRHNVVPSIEGDSRAISKVKALISKVAQTEASVLILGESGTGKEIVARMLHRQSARADKPFIPINCGAIPSELLESELFGHEKGAFTGAISARAGRFELADQGTLFLDEIGDMDLSMQVKLLRVLQERTFERVGSNKTMTTDVRIVAATHRSLEQQIEKGKFREDLFYRLNVFPIEMPALRDRAEDIPALVASMIKRLANERGSYTISHRALEILKQYSWPGNVRELSNLVERLRILFPDQEVQPEHLPEKYTGGNALLVPVESPAAQPVSTQHARNVLPPEGIDLKSCLKDIEIDLIQQALHATNGVVAQAAKRLGLRRTTLVEKIKKFDLQREELAS